MVDGGWMDGWMDDGWWMDNGPWPMAAAAVDSGSADGNGDGGNSHHKLLIIITE